MENKTTQTFLEKNYTLVLDAINEDFSGLTKLGITVEINNFLYYSDECSLSEGYKFGPGVSAKLILKQADRKDDEFDLYYLDKQCDDWKPFLRDLNTDIGLLQLICGKTTESLQITHYDLYADTITFTATSGETLEAKGLSTCWDVDTLTFNITAFKALKAETEKECGADVVPVTRGGRSMFFSPDPSVPSPSPSSLPEKITVLGIDRSKFLAPTSPTLNM